MQHIFGLLDICKAAFAILVVIESCTIADIIENVIFNRLCRLVR
jgi:hypothetical protein